MFFTRTIFRVLLVALLVMHVRAEDVAGDAKGGAISFQAEVSKMLDILINSLYTNRAIFLRELISNGSDALDKIRVLYLTAPQDPLNKDGASPTMDVRISLDKDKHQLKIRDGGIGMTKEDLTNNLGSLGTSGTKRFFENMKDSKENGNNLIGQFGVGFYSAFLVAHRVRVASKHDNSTMQYVWESTGDGKYYLYEDPDGNTLGRGTEITLDIKPDASEYLSMETIKKTVHQYSEFINFPIYVLDEVLRQPEGATTPPRGPDAAPKTEEETQPEAPEPIKSLEWVLVNENRPIWTRPLGNVTEEEYNTFYKAMTKDYRNPMFYSHFKVEGEVEFHSLLFIPEAATSGLFGDQLEVGNNIRLYVRRVFITDEFRDLLPRYLNFVKGVVDSDDLPLNVSREVLQENRILRVIKKKLVRKALAMFADIAEQNDRVVRAASAAEAKKDQPAPTVPPTPSGTKHLPEPMYDKFWESFGKNIRYGLLQDSNNRGRLTKLLRYKSSKTENGYISLQEYIDAMKKGQKGIYYLSGDSIDKIKQSPLLQDPLQRDVEVLFMTDAIDEYVADQVTDFAGKKLINLAKEGVQFDDESKQQQVIDKKRREKYEPLFTRLQEIFGRDQVSRFALTKRHTTEAFILSSGQNQITARLSNLLRGHVVGGNAALNVAVRVLEVNYRHPLVDELFKRFSVDENDSVATDMAWVLFDTANIQAEFPVKDIAAYARRINRLLRVGVDLTADDSLLPPDDEEYLTEEVTADESADEAAATPAASPGATYVSSDGESAESSTEGDL